MEKGYGSGEQKPRTWICRGHWIRRDVLWHVREKGVKADQYDSVDGTERGTDLFD